MVPSTRTTTFCSLRNCENKTLHYGVTTNRVQRSTYIYIYVQDFLRLKPRYSQFVFKTTFIA